MRASGKTGSLRVGYQHAAALGAWTMALASRRPLTYTVRARVLSEHSFWYLQRPIDIVLNIAGVDWVWRGVSFTRELDEIVLTVSESPIVE